MKPETVKYLLDCYLDEKGAYDVTDSLHLQKVCKAPNLEYSNNLARQLHEPPVSVDVVEQEKCKLIAQKLLKISEEFETRRSIVSQQNQSVLPQLPNQDLDENERDVLNKIQSTGFFPSVADVSRYLSDHLTSRTFKVALFHLCGQATSFSQELTLAFELYNATLPRSRRESITEVLTEFLKDKPDLDAL